MPRNQNRLGPCDGTKEVRCFLRNRRRLMRNSIIQPGTTMYLTQERPSWFIWLHLWRWGAIPEWNITLAWPRKKASRMTRLELYSPSSWQFPPAGSVPSSTKSSARFQKRSARENRTKARKKTKLRDQSANRPLESAGCASR